MKLTTREHYSVNHLWVLTLQRGSGLTSVRPIAPRQELPAPCVKKLLIKIGCPG